MQMTIKNVLDKVDSIRSIMRNVETGGSLEYCENEVLEYLEEYMKILLNYKVEIG